MNDTGSKAGSETGSKAGSKTGSKTGIITDTGNEIWESFKQNKGARWGLWIVLFFCSVALFAPLLAPHDPTQVFSDHLKAPPFWSEGGGRDFWLGTDDIGRDLLSRLILGSRISLGIGFFVVGLSLIGGVVLGLIAGSAPTWIEQLILRSMDIIMALPSVLLAVVIVTLLGPGLVSTVLAVGIVSLPNVVRLVRSVVAVERNKNYVIATRTFGGSWWRVFVVNILPNCMAPLIVQASLGFSDGILNAAALGFLGLGAQPPLPEWGTMLSDGRSFIESAPSLVFFPGLCILILVLSFNLVGDGLRDSLDPKLRRSE